MAVVSRHLSASMRVIDSSFDTVHSYHSINPGIETSQVETFLQGVNMLRGQAGGNVYMTLTTELAEESA